MQNIAQLHVTAVLTEAQTIEDDAVTFPTLRKVLESIGATYSALKANNTPPSIRNQFVACIFKAITTKIFNAVVRQESLSMTDGMTLQLLHQNMTEWAVRVGGNALIAATQPHVAVLKEVAMLLLMDKSDCTIAELTGIAPTLSPFTLHHLLFVYEQSEDHTDTVPPKLLQDIAQLIAANEASGMDMSSDDGNEQLSAELSVAEPMLIDIGIVLGEFVLEAVPVPNKLKSDPNFSFLTQQED